MALSFGETGERLRRSTVQVFSPGGYGSGVVWSADGIVITNAHVVQGDRTLVETWDGRRLPATVFGRDLRRDLIRLRLDTQLEAVLYRDTGGVRPGELVIAVGSPLGFTGALSTGVVHAVGPLAGVEVVTYICKSKLAVIDFFRGAGVPDSMLASWRTALKQNPQSVKKALISRDVLRRLNEAGEPMLGKRREMSSACPSSKTSPPAGKTTGTKLRRW